MDPLNTTASIIAVLQATNVAVSICNNYCFAAKSSSWEYPQVISESGGLRTVFENLTELVNKTKSTRGTSDSFLFMLSKLCDPNDGALGECVSELEALKKKLAPPSWSGTDGSQRRALIEALGWPLKRDETMKMLTAIGRFKATLSLGMSSDQMYVQSRSIGEEWGYPKVRRFLNSFDATVSDIFNIWYLSHHCPPSSYSRCRQNYDIKDPGDR